MHAYLYYLSDENFRKVYLLDKTRRVVNKKKIGDLEGVFLSEVSVEDSDLTFSIGKKEEIGLKYSGKFIEFD